MSMARLLSEDSVRPRHHQQAESGPTAMTGTGVPVGVQRGATGVCRRAQEVKVPFQGHKCTFQYCKPFAHLLKVIQFFVAPYWLSLTVHRAVILPDVCVRT